MVLGVNTRLAAGIYSAIVGSILTRPCSFYPILSRLSVSHVAPSCRVRKRRLVNKDKFGSKRRQAGGRESKAGEEMEKTNIEQTNEGSTDLYTETFVNEPSGATAKVHESM